MLRSERLGPPGYEITEVLGRGGFATVYRANQLAVGREVALKIDERVLSSARDRQRFMREVTAAGQLSDHPHVVALHDAGVLADGRPFMVLELCPNGSLADRLRRGGRLPAVEARAIGVHIADALAAAHNAGVLHRDVKPGNILVNQFGEVALADFGLAAMPRPGHELSATREALTPAYAPPEAFRMADPTPLGDVYALGATVYALLRGRPPHYPDQGDLSLAELIVRHTEPVPDLPGVPSALTEVLRQAMACDPADRLPGATALRDTLAAVDLQTHYLVPGAEAPVPQPAPRTPSRPYPATVPATLPGTVPRTLSTTREDPATDRPAAAGDRRGRLGGRRTLVLAPVLALAAAGLGVGAVLAQHKQKQGATPGASAGSTRSAASAQVGFNVATVTKDCPASSVPGAYARCTKDAECWGGMIVTLGFVQMYPADCRTSHIWETFAIAKLPTDAQTDNQEVLERHPLLLKLCSRQVMAQSRRSAASLRIAPKDWEVDVFPPTEAQWAAGLRVLRCVATVPGHERPGSAFRPAS